MVETQHELVKRVFGIKHLTAVMGISMGGMQTFQWIVAFPDFMAMLALDVSAPFCGSMERSAAAVRAKVFVVVSKNDLTVTPGPAIDFAHLLKARLLVLDDDCSHQAPGCEVTTIVPAIAEFLSQP
jgi:homoserine acetyltransferase